MVFECKNWHMYWYFVELKTVSKFYRFNFFKATSYEQGLFLTENISDSSYKKHKQFCKNFRALENRFFLAIYSKRCQHNLSIKSLVWSSWKKKKKIVELLCSNFLKRLSFPEFICMTSQVGMFVEFKIENWD